MTRICAAVPVLLCFGVVPACLGAKDDAKPARRMSAPQHFESHAAWLLQRMIKVNLALDETKAHAVDLVFADYYRRTAEQLPRPVLIAYPITEGSTDSQVNSDTIAAQTGQHIKGKIQRTADGSPVMLVENVLKVLDAGQELAFRGVLQRWAQIKPEPVSIPIIEIMRASRDPLLALTPAQRKKLDKLLRAKGKDAMSAGVTGASSSEIEPMAERIRLEFVAMLTPNQRRQFEATLTFVEQDTADWRALEIGGDALYAKALVLLAAEAKKKKSTSD